MKKLLNIKNIAIAILVAIVILEIWNPGGIMPGKTIRIAGKSYEIIKHEIDTVDVIKTKVVTKKGEDIFHEIIQHDTTVKLVNVDSAAILKDYLSKVVYKDVLVLPDSLGTVAVTDTIHKNRILGRTFDAKVKERTIKETMIVKEPARNQVYFGFNGGFNKTDVVSNIGTGLILKTKKDKIYQFGVGVANRTIDGTNGSLSPYIGGGVYWKIKLKK